MHSSLNEQARHAVILGAPRSGTTLLATMLGNHPLVHIPVDTYVHRCSELRDALARSINHLDFNTVYLVQQVSNRLDRARYDQFLRGRGDVEDEIGWRALISQGIDQQLKAADKKIWCDKSPLSINLIPELVWLLPHVRVIHVIRDGRAVAVSQRERQSSDLLVAIQAWKSQLCKGRFFGGALQDQYFEVRYESLLREPRETLESICRYIGVNFSEDMLSLPDSQEGQNLLYVKSSLEINKIDHWQRNVTKREIRRMEHIAGDLLKYYQYKLIEHDESGPFRALSPISFILRTQQSYIRQLLQRSHQAMKSRQLVDLNRPIGERFRRFFRKSLALWLSAELLEQFRNDPRMLD